MHNPECEVEQNDMPEPIVIKNPDDEPCKDCKDQTEISATAACEKTRKSCLANKVKIAEQKEQARLA